MIELVKECLKEFWYFILAFPFLVIIFRPYMATRRLIQ